MGKREPEHKHQHERQLLGNVEQHQVGKHIVAGKERGEPQGYDGEGGEQQVRDVLKRAPPSYVREGKRRQAAQDGAHTGAQLHPHANRSLVLMSEP